MHSWASSCSSSARPTSLFLACVFVFHHWRTLFVLDKERQEVIQEGTAFAVLLSTLLLRLCTCSLFALMAVM
jgi:hypothetical protein